MNVENRPPLVVGDHLYWADVVDGEVEVTSAEVLSFDAYRVWLRYGDDAGKRTLTLPKAALVPRTAREAAVRRLLAAQDNLREQIRLSSSEGTYRSKLLVEVNKQAAATEVELLQDWLTNNTTET